MRPNQSGGSRGAGGGSLADRNITAQKASPRPDAGAKGDAAASGYSNAKDEVPLKFLTQESIAEIFGLNPQTNTLQNPDNYLAFLKQNGLVYINTGGSKAPVTEVLQELGRQSNTPILIDPSVPTGPKFNLQGYISPRTLPEAMQVLTQSSRLTWRWLGGSIYVSALPDFQLFYNSASPRVIFGSSGLPSQQGGQGQQSSSNNGAYAVPNQPPLPITNGDKKTP